VGAPAEQSAGDYNRNREQTYPRRGPGVKRWGKSPPVSFRKDGSWASVRPGAR